MGGEALLIAADIDPETRPQDLDIESFCKLANLYESKAFS
jgi:16S rRNA A1518/A1519 N6-dimethyltransferase RsmA/KsgA/DIM1 with predicted DNA glycosylase/AP lyase activity